MERPSGVARSSTAVPSFAVTCCATSDAVNTTAKKIETEPTVRIFSRRRGITLSKYRAKGFPKRQFANHQSDLEFASERRPPSYRDTTTPALQEAWPFSASVTCAPKLYVPALVGVPLTTPLEEASDRPGGSGPPVIE